MNVKNLQMHSFTNCEIIKIKEYREIVETQEKVTHKKTF